MNELRRKASQILGTSVEDHGQLLYRLQSWSVITTRDHDALLADVDKLRGTIDWLREEIVLSRTSAPEHARDLELPDIEKAFAETERMARLLGRVKTLSEYGIEVSCGDYADWEEIVSSNQKLEEWFGMPLEDYIVRELENFDR